MPAENRIKAAHRAHQGWWREYVLQRPSGEPTDKRTLQRYRTLPNYLPEVFEGRKAEQEGLNLMSPAARTYTRERQAQLAAIGGLAEEGRLWRNMLSSQPLAFSIAGELRAHPAAAAAMLGELSGLPVDSLLTLEDSTYFLTGVEAEWFPRREAHTQDRSGFDLAAALRLEDGTRVLLTVEVKYVDTFSPAQLDPTSERYAPHLDAVGIDPVSAVTLVAAGCSQFLRSVLLTDSVRRTGVRGVPGSATVDRAMAVVLARGDDDIARTVVSAIGAHAVLTATAFWSHEDFFAAAGRQPALAEWAHQLERRYLLPHGTPS